MKQTSDVETTTSSRPPLCSPLKGFPRRDGVTAGFAFIIRGGRLQGMPDRVVDFYDRHPISEAQVLAAVARRRGGVEGALTAEDLFEFDQDHYGGLDAGDTLARRAGGIARSRGLAVCAGLAGPGRFLASRRGC